MRSASDQRRLIVEQFESLSARAQEVFAILSTSLAEREAAEAMGISRNTIHGYVKHIYGVMRIHSRQELMAAVEADPTFLKRMQTKAKTIKPRRRPQRVAADHLDTGNPEKIIVHIELSVLAALREHIDNLPEHLAELARREAERLGKERTATP